MTKDADPVAVARHLGPEIIAARQDAEQRRHLPAALADRLASAGLYRLYLPRALGGLELSPMTVFRVIETLSEADGSVGWCLMNSNGVSLYTGWLPPDVGRQMVGEPLTFRAAGSLRPQGRAKRVEGGYRLSGKWNFVSGLLNANWLSCPTVIMDGDRPELSAAGTTVQRTMWGPVSDETPIDTWSVIGMRGTGSHDLIIDDLFVPDAHTVSLTEPPMNAGPLSRSRLFLLLVQVLFAANAIGIARCAVNALVDLASREASTWSSVLLRDRPAGQGR